MQAMELPKITKSANTIGPLKFNSRLTSADTKILTHLQNDNVFFKKKLAEFENRLNSIADKGENSKFNKFNHTKLREKSSIPHKSEVPSIGGLSRKESMTCLNLNSASRINTGRSSILTARTTESTSKMDDILNNLKKHRRSALRRNAFENNSEIRNGSQTHRPQTSSNLPGVGKLSDEKLNERLEEVLSRKSNKSRKSSRKSRAKTAAVVDKEKEKDDEYCHMFYSRSWRIHPELGIIKDKDRTTYDNTQTHFYHTRREPPETFIFSPDWV